MPLAPLKQCCGVAGEYLGITNFKRRGLIQVVAISNEDRGGLVDCDFFFSVKVVFVLFCF